MSCRSFAGSTPCWATSKTSLNGTFPAFNFGKYAKRYLGGFCFRFNSRFAMAAMRDRM
jgi:hypothetical protein